MQGFEEAGAVERPVLKGFLGVCLLSVHGLALSTPPPPLRPPHDDCAVATSANTISYTPKRTRQRTLSTEPT